jgi:hypothetical protein
MDAQSPAIAASRLRIAEQARSLAVDGVVVLQDAVAPALIDAARIVCVNTLERKRTLVTRRPLEQYGRHPFVALRAVLADIVRPIVGDLTGCGSSVGGACWIRSAGPAAQKRQVHRDVPADARAIEAFGVDVFLTPFTPDNGATAFWP